MASSKEIKCVVWDLDNTIWDGILLEDKAVTLKAGIIEIIKELDSRGILNSIASRNNYDDAITKIKEFGISEYFLYPEISWNSKSTSIQNIQKNLNIGIDTFLFIDDQRFELDEVISVHPQIWCIDAAEYRSILSLSRLNPRFITKDSIRRREMYIQDITRSTIEENFSGPKEDFLKSLEMQFIISKAKRDDLERAEELTDRTHQLNSTGVTYDFNQLDNFRKSDKHCLLICELIDKYGSYGKIGLALAEITKDEWHLKLLLMSCRVISRGVGSILLYHIMNETKKDNKKLLADFKRTDRNKMMYVTFKFSNFKELHNDNNGNILFESDLSFIPPFPFYLKIQIV
jgi:FkbH-like protein